MGGSCLTQGWVILCLCTVGPECGNMWVGGGWGGLQLADHPGPESVLTEMFAQLKHQLLRHITEGCQWLNESMESMNETANIFNLFWSEKAGLNMSTLLLCCLQPLSIFTGPYGMLVSLLTLDGVESMKLFLLLLLGLTWQLCHSKSQHPQPLGLYDSSYLFTHSALTVSVSEMVLRSIWM